jgi:hypothetical protein
MEEVTAWQNRPLKPCYPIVFMDAIRVNIRIDGAVANKAGRTALPAVPKKNHRRARTRRLRGLTRPVPAVRPTTGAAQCEKALVHRSDSGNLRVSRHTTWGMSGKTGVFLITGHSINTDGDFSAKYFL